MNLSTRAGGHADVYEVWTEGRNLAFRALPTLEANALAAIVAHTNQGRPGFLAAEIVPAAGPVKRLSEERRAH